MSRCLYGHPASDLAHGREERQEPIRRLYRLIGDGVDLTLHQELRETLVGRKVQIREELLALPETVVLLRNGLFYLHDKIRRLEDLVGPVDDAPPSFTILPISETRAIAGTGLDHHLVAVMHQLGNPIWLHRDTALHVLDLLRYPYRRHNAFLSLVAPTLSVPYSKATINVQRCWQGLLSAAESWRWLLVWLPALGGRVGAQPQRDVLRLHRLPDYPDQIVAEGAQVGFVAKLRGELFERLSSVVLASVETAVDEGLDTPAPQRVEQGGDRERGDDDGELR